MTHNSEKEIQAASEVGGSKVKETITGQVLSAKMNKTIVVEVERRIPHPTFKKIVRRSTKYYAHDEAGEAKVGDTVVIRASRPISKLKRWVLIEVK